MNIEDISRILPHRYPFLLVDSVESIDVGKRIVGKKCVTVNEPFFQGHFPEKKIMPGVMIVEALAQCSGTLIKQEEAYKDSFFFLGGIEKARFRLMVIPGMVLHLTSELLKAKRGFFWFNTKAHVEGELVATSEILLVMSHDY